VNKAFAHVEKMLYLSLWFQNISCTDTCAKRGLWEGMSYPYYKGYRYMSSLQTV
jgi:hypothetical protein